MSGRSKDGEYLKQFGSRPLETTPEPIACEHLLDHVVTVIDGVAPDLARYMAPDPDDDPVVLAYLAAPGSSVQVLIGSPRGGPLVRLLLDRVDTGGPDDAHLRAHLGAAYDAEQADLWDECFDAFRAHLAEGHLYDGYRPYPGGPAWPHRAAHARWRDQQRAAWQREQGVEAE